ncbi:hypothetical protein R41_256 [Klebsiella phage R4_1]|nr:hypothetical protein R41_256 [Klebsiella phage R4_1]
MLVSMRALGLVTIAGMMTMCNFIWVVIGLVVFTGVMYMCHQEDLRRERKARK